jgi:hypothetical protein
VGRAYYQEIYSKYSRFQYSEAFECDPRWWAWYCANLKCKQCPWPNEAWQDAPQPMDVLLIGAFPGVTTTPSTMPVELVRSDLRDIVAPFLPEAVWGRCIIEGHSKPTGHEFFTLQVPRRAWVSTARGKGSGHAQCLGCGHVVSRWPVTQAISAATARDRPIVVSDSGAMYIKSGLAKELRLRERFEDLRLFNIPLIAKPCDGWVLPEDAGWTGVLEPNKAFFQTLDPEIYPDLSRPPD